MTCGLARFLLLAKMKKMGRLLKHFRQKKYTCSRSPVHFYVVSILCASEVMSIFTTYYVCLQEAWCVFLRFHR